MSLARRIETVPSPLAPAATTVAAGGPVAAMQQALAERLAEQGVAATLAAPYAPGRVEAFTAAASRLTGIVALAIGFAATGMWLFG